MPARLPKTFESVAIADGPDAPTIRAVAQSSGAERATRPHRHASGQLLGAMQGLITVDVRDGRWVVPATHAVWLPPHVMHGLRSHGPFAGWSVYVDESAAAALPAEPRILAVSGLLREAVARAVDWDDATGPLTPPQARLAGVILDEVALSAPVALGLPMPADPRLLKIARALSARPDDARGLAEWADWAGIAPRTLTRRFVEETGFSFTEWRQRVRLLRGLELLAAGKPVMAIALELGYDNVSAFIALFKRTFGVTPGRYGEPDARG
ncbi:helix-turn-helix transcriptional regulator [Mitsuaria sp. GD03876]|uniref:AraC family transcriptional regulator n=1 Tax=Mitsuaria sp. GD03876 TaxID=2975399 RepID=UPI00244BF4FB|nr:helix-turn-helix transcriptional regulator [Mitsuaria sp. GD03876]MDH0864704.1 helix-turn-helix transcriptional regulator [Mitsuaria sp. GD03876]